MKECFTPRKMLVTLGLMGAAFLAGCGTETSTNVIDAVSTTGTVTYLATDITIDGAWSRPDHSVPEPNLGQISENDRPFGVAENLRVRYPLVVQGQETDQYHPGNEWFGYGIESAGKLRLAFTARQYTTQENIMYADENAPEVQVRCDELRVTNATASNEFHTAIACILNGATQLLALSSR